MQCLLGQPKPDPESLLYTIEGALSSVKAVSATVGVHLMTTPSAPGWYDDPYDSRALRRWDGHQWTPERRRKAGQSVPQPPAERCPKPPEIPPRVRSYIAIAMGVCGAVLCLAGSLEWGRAREVGLWNGEPAVATITFWGVGEVQSRMDVAGEVSKFKNPAAFENTNAGWPAILLGILTLVAVFAWHRMNLLLPAAIGLIGIGLSGLAIFGFQMSDLRRTFGDFAAFGDSDFQAGPGLLISIVLSGVILGLGLYVLYIRPGECSHTPT